MLSAALLEHLLSDINLSYLYWVTSPVPLLIFGWSGLIKLKAKKKYFFLNFAIWYDYVGQSNP